MLHAAGLSLSLQTRIK